MADKPVANIKNINGNQRFDFNVALYNAIEKTGFSFTPDAIIRLEIEDNLFEMFHRGYIIFDNTEDAIQRATIKFDSLGNIKDNSPYIFENNTRDLLIVKINPLLDNDTIPKDIDKDSLFKLDFVFSIYDTEDLIVNGKKCKKLYFNELEERYLQEHVPYFTTSDYIINKLKNISKLSNADRAINTGDAIKNVITKSLKTYGLTPAFDTFDSGMDKIFYSSPGTDSAIDVISYIKNRHLSSLDNNQGSLSIIFKDRNTKKYNLLPLTKLFDGAYKNGIIDSYGTTNIEHFILPGPGETVKGIPPTSRTPDKKTTIYLNELSIIKNYNYTFASGVDINQLLLDRVVYNYNHGQGEFKIGLKDGEVQNVMAKLKTLYISKMKGNIKSGASSILNNMYGIQNHINTYSIEQNPNKIYGQNKNLFVALFLGDSLTFSCIGMTHRRAGRFIGVSKETIVKPNPFDDKVLGQHFVTNTKHIFEGNNYSNEIITIKPYKF